MVKQIQISAEHDQDRYNSIGSGIDDDDEFIQIDYD